MNKKLFKYIFSGIVIIILSGLFLIYRNLFAVNISAQKNHKAIYIPTGSSYRQVLDTLEKTLNIKDLKVLDWIAKRKNYPRLIKPGKYVVDTDMSYVGFINMLRSGKQKPVTITFSNVRTFNQLAGKFGKIIETDSSSLVSFFGDDSNYKSDGFTRENIIALFIPNSYEVYWNTDPYGLYKRMLKEYHLFWNRQRLAKAKELGLDPMEVAILASIIDDEVAKTDEKPRIAGVYLNRLKRGIPLQACPTIKFALNDFTITRILKKYLTVDSPYNTYTHNGFPPGPISCPSIDGIDAVLNAEKHDYIFFAAMADFSGYHNFSRTLSEHNRYAALYQRELNKRKIFR